MFFSKPNSAMLYQFRKKVLNVIESKLKDQKYYLLRDVQVNEFDKTSGGISFGASMPLNVSSRIELYSKFETMDALSRKFTMKLAYAVDPENVVILQTLGPVFIAPFQAISKLILKKVFG